MTRMLRVIYRTVLIRAQTSTMSSIKTFKKPSMRKAIPEKVKEMTCSRCHRMGHLSAYCIAKYDIGGHEIEDNYEDVGTGTHA